MADVIVTNTADSGAGSLRQAILDAAGGDTIVFAAGLAGSTITLASQLLLDKDITIVGDIDGDRKADITISGGGNVRIFQITGADTEVELRSLTLTEGNAADGGAILGLSGKLTVIDSTVSGSHATAVGGGIAARTLTLVNSTVTGNTSDHYGGGVFISADGTGTFVNATIHDNSAGREGGGISNDPDATLTILNSTITGNHADGRGGGLDIYQGATATISNSVIAGNTADGGDADVSKTTITNTVQVLNADNSLFGAGADIDSGSGNQVGTATQLLDPKLGPLADNGGPVFTQAILPGSPLIGAGNVALLPDDDFDLDGNPATDKLPFDARGNARVQGGLDIGAFEAPNAAPVLTGLDSPVTFAENTVNAAPQLLDADVTFTDPDNNFDGGTLTVAGLLAEDTVSIRDQGTGAGQIGFGADVVTFGGVAIGTVSGGDAGTDLTVTFNAAAAAAAIEALIQNLTYANSSDTPTASRTLTITVTDAEGAVTRDLSQPDFAQQTGAANPFDGIDVGTFSTPTLADLDGDGDLDLVVGEAFGTLLYFQNTGSAAAPVFVAQTGATNPFGGIDVGFSSTPTLADLDGDGDFDLVVGANDRTLHYFQNTGTAAAPAFVEQTGAANPFDGIDVGGLPTPTLADLDGDGDLDLVVGASDGTLHYYRNTGTAAAPVFVAQTGTANPFDGIDVGGVSTPALADLDGDGDLDLVVGENDGNLNYYRNTGTAAAPVFVAQTGVANPFDGIDVGVLSAPALADLDGDGDLDLVVGENDGNLNFFRNDAPAGIPIVVNVTDESDIGVTIIGSNKADLVDASNTVTGQPLPTDINDIIFGNNGHDDLSGLFGNDIIDGGKGNDILRGGGGDDILQVKGQQGTRDIFDGGSGTDTLQFLGNGTVKLAGFDATASSIEILQGNSKGLTGSGQNDTFDLSGLSAMTGVLFVDGAGGNDTLIGSAFADDLRGGSGSDTLDGGAGDDILRGGNGRDTFVFADGYGSDIVADYKAKQDVFDFTGVSGVSSFADLFLTQIDPKTVLIDFDGVLGGDTLTVQKTTIAILTANQADFLFA